MNPDADSLPGAELPDTDFPEADFPDADFLDGNAAAGPLREVFTVDLTAASGQCMGCGRTAVLAEARLYMRAPGLVARCAACQGVLLRLVRGPGRTWLDMRGLAYLELVTLGGPE